MEKLSEQRMEKIEGGGYGAIFTPVCLGCIGALCAAGLLAMSGPVSTIAMAVLASVGTTASIAAVCGPCIIAIGE